MCIEMRPFVGEDVLYIRVSYLHSKLRPVTFCMMTGWHLFLSLVLYHSPVFIIPSPPSNCFVVGRGVGKGVLTVPFYWNILHFTEIRKKLSQVHLGMLMSPLPL